MKSISEGTKTSTIPFFFRTDWFLKHWSFERWLSWLEADRCETDGIGKLRPVVLGGEEAFLVVWTFDCISKSRSLRRFISSWRLSTWPCKTSSFKLLLLGWPSLSSFGASSFFRRRKSAMVIRSIWCVVKRNEKCVCDCKRARTRTISSEMIVSITMTKLSRDYRRKWFLFEKLVSSTFFVDRIFSRE